MTGAALHDAYAPSYDADVQAYDCHIAEVLFGLCYEGIAPGRRLLDVGIGSGLSAEAFARAGLEIYGMDFSPAMLELCRAKGFAKHLEQHDVVDVPWPYPSGYFDHVTCCGVMHFIGDLEGIFGEAGRVLVDGGTFSFTTRVSARLLMSGQNYDSHTAGEFDIFSHSREYVDKLLIQNAFAGLKTQRCFVGEDSFASLVVRRRSDLEHLDSALGV